MDCLFSDQSKAMIHVFFGDREVAKIPDIPKETPLIPVNRAAVIGAGTMGGGITMVFANAGIPVLMKETDQAALDRGMDNIRKNYENSVKRGRFTQAIRRRAPETDHANSHLRRIRKRRHGHRSRLRRHGPEKANLRRTRPHLQTRRNPRQQHVYAKHRRNRQRHLAPAKRDRHALFQSGKCYAPAGNRPRQKPPAKK